MGQLKRRSAGLIIVSPRLCDGWHTVTVAFDDGTEALMRVRDSESLYALAEALDCARALVYRPPAWFQLCE